MPCPPPFQKASFASAWRQPGRNTASTNGATRPQPMAPHDLNQWSHPTSINGATRPQPMEPPVLNQWSHPTSTNGATRPQPMAPPDLNQWSHPTSTNGATRPQPMAPPQPQPQPPSYLGCQYITILFTSDLRILIRIRQIISQNHGQCTKILTKIERKC